MDNQLLNEYTLYISNQFFSPCCSTSGVDHLIELRTRTGPSFLVFLRSPLEVTFSYFVSLDFETVQQCYTIARLFPASSFWALSFFSSIAEHTLFWFESMKIRVWVGKIFPPAEIWTADLLHRKPMLWPLCYGAPPLNNDCYLDRKGVLTKSRIIVEDV